MRVLFIGKRYYTGRDALLDRFGRIHELPWHWHSSGTDASLYLLDYRSFARCSVESRGYRSESLPMLNPRSVAHLRALGLAFKPDFVVASGDCFVGLVGLNVARACQSRFVFDVYDDYRKFGGYKAFLGMDAYGFLLRQAALVFYASRAMAACHVPGSPCHVAPNGVDPNVFKAMDQGDAKAEVGLHDDGTIWVGYFGGMDPERGAEDLVEAVGLVHEQDRRVRLVLCGPLATQAALRRPWVTSFGKVDHSRVSWFINACDVVALPYRRGPVIDMASSCKIAEYMYCQRPIVATRTPNLMQNFPTQAEEMGESLCRPGDVADIARAIRHQLACRRTVSVPANHDWQGIAADAMGAMEALMR